jgi:hypothetical protein
MDEERTLPIDAYIVAVDETYMYSIDLEDKSYIKRILGVYLIDTNEVTHLCELSGSYRAYWISISVELTEAGGELNYEKAGKIFDKFEMEGGDDTYFHVSDIDKIIGTDDSFHYGSTGTRYDQTSYEDQISLLLEWASNNPSF